MTLIFHLQSEPDGSLTNEHASLLTHRGCDEIQIVPLAGPEAYQQFVEFASHLACRTRFLENHLFPGVPFESEPLEP